jgi:hypothetical protein
MFSLGNKTKRNKNRLALFSHAQEKHRTNFFASFCFNFLPLFVSSSIFLLHFPFKMKIIVLKFSSILSSVAKPEPQGVKCNAVIFYLVFYPLDPHSGWFFFQISDPGSSQRWASLILFQVR